MLVLNTYLRLNTSAMNIELTPLVKSLSGVIQLPSDFDYKEDYTAFLIKKYEYKKVE
ncbi:DUF6364 family protein [Sinomicrobium weinanense]|uniref:DUF6364 family protein n=1 Tax=Sinomicrobium weinanense TaxID=2842200 RepID=UPI0031EB5492